MVNIYEILQRAASLKEETALNSISPKRAGGIMYDTLLALNVLWLRQDAALVISKIYASVAAMQADTAPVSDLTGQPLKPGQIVVIASSDSDNGSVYRYNGTDAPSWSLVGTIGNLTPVDNLDSDSIILPLAAHQGKVLDGKIGQLQQEIDKKYTKPSTGIPATDMTESVRRCLELADSSATLNRYIIEGGHGLKFVASTNSYLVRIENENEEFVYLISCGDDYTNTQVTALMYSTPTGVSFYLCRDTRLLIWVSSAFSRFSIISLRGNGAIDSETIDEMPEDVEEIVPGRYATDLDLALEQQEIDKKYTKPSTGIPASDLAEGVIPDVSQFITRTVNDLANYYLKNEIYTKDEVVALIGAIQQFHYEVYASLPETGTGNVLYLIGPTGTGSDRYEEYVYANGTFTKIGDTSIDLSDYAKSIDIPIEKGLGANSVQQKGAGAIASGPQSTAFGFETEAYGPYSHAEGKYSQCSGIASHAEGRSQAHKDYSHSEGSSTDCHGECGHTEGAATSVAGNYAHAEGDGGNSSEIAIVSINGNVFTLSSVDGLTTDSVLKYDEFYYRVITIDVSTNAVTVDKQIAASSWDTGTRERYGVAYGIASHVEGRQGIAFGTNSHVEGNEGVADGNASHAEGYNTRTRNNNEHAEGQYNKSNPGTIHSVGIGTSESDRKNAFEIMQNGDAYLKGIGGYDGTNPSGAQTVKQVMDSRESITNKTTSLSSESTDQQYPSAKAVYDFVMDKLGDIETLLAAI